MVIWHHSAAPQVLPLPQRALRHLPAPQLDNVMVAPRFQKSRWSWMMRRETAPSRMLPVKLLFLRPSDGFFDVEVLVTVRSSSDQQAARLPAVRCRMGEWPPTATSEPPSYPHLAYDCLGYQPTCPTSTTTKSPKPGPTRVRQYWPPKKLCLPVHRGSLLVCKS